MFNRPISNSKLPEYSHAPPPYQTILGNLIPTTHLPLLFPRSVSPYVSRRKSEEATWQDNNRGDHRFYSTPQLGPTYGATIANAAYECNTAKGGFRKKQGKFSIFANLFRSRSDDFESDPRFTSRDSCEPSSSSSSSPSWFGTIFPGRRKKQSAMISVEGNTVTCQRPRQLAHRGMSPAGAVDFDEGCDGYDRSPSGSGNSSELSPKWRKTPIVAPPSARRSGRNVSGITFCLSPLVRASPNWHCKKSMPPDLTVSSEIRFTGKPQLSSAVDYYGNRSRKLADFGRSNRNR
ncbi:Transposon protein [Quillaja saponaria]|uniref:Transposon protein n=1 Tax=Quillaja saponaria TaxID=32244 RepID=A0AAD7PCQ3_QUISA|nr:Transposon protein [Quillaja saponaria]KAJ7950696.1 Transposon protein [Quillaja saponaria]